jgi:D-glycero-D-manno-heptose 1,7-bisphosphate phosphatase
MDTNWIKGCNTLFLDRDGVINYEISDGYVLDKSQFKFMPGVIDAITILHKYFKHIIVVTNQRCIGKGLLTEDGLKEIHQYMCSEIEAAGGRIDAIYFATALSNDDPYRKPNAGMALRAAQEHQLDLEQAIMVGNKKSDMLFAQNAGIKAVFVTTTNEAPQEVPINLVCKDLGEFASWYNQAIQKA